MNPDIKARWTAALRSGEYIQGTDYLKTSDGKYCCLGVLCELAVQDGVIPPPRQEGEVYPKWWYGEQNDDISLPALVDISLPALVKDWAGLNSPSPHFPNPDYDPDNPRFGPSPRTYLSSINDFGTPFEDIAKIIEEHF